MGEVISQNCTTSQVFQAQGEVILQIKILLGLVILHVK